MAYKGGSEAIVIFPGAPIVCLCRSRNVTIYPLTTKKKRHGTPSKILHVLPVCHERLSACRQYSRTALL